ncbi:hypothetical protein M0R45_009615 [Rubus argutus]|uniref:Uncharacterized protein n=1 Tax=Rubus argutus TaxID=59490 RepID=A0AAW1Y5M7_RUBAR
MFGCSKLEKLLDNVVEMECLEQLWISQTAIRELPFLLHMKNLKTLDFSGSRVIRKHDVGFGRLLGRKSLEPVPLVLPSLRALCSLVALNLSDHNLCEGDIPDDIGCLSSLQQLNLSGNNFVTLPTSIQCLSMLWTLDLKRCERLEQLPDLPSNGQLRVCVDNCASLKMLSEPSN